MKRINSFFINTLSPPKTRKENPRVIAIKFVGVGWRWEWGVGRGGVPDLSALPAHTESETKDIVFEIGGCWTCSVLVAAETQKRQQRHRLDEQVVQAKWSTHRPGWQGCESWVGHGQAILGKRSCRANGQWQELKVGEWSGQLPPPAPEALQREVYFPDQCLAPWHTDSYKASYSRSDRVLVLPSHWPHCFMFSGLQHRRSQRLEGQGEPC